MCWLIVLRASWLRSLFVWADIGVIFVRELLVSGFRGGSRLFQRWYVRSRSARQHRVTIQCKRLSDNVQRQRGISVIQRYPWVTRRALKPGNPGIKKIITEWGKTQVLTSQVCTLASRNGQNYGNIEPSWSQENLQTKSGRRKIPMSRGLGKSTLTRKTSEVAE
jgi:hypothetical protein